MTVAVAAQEQEHYEIFLPQLNASEMYQIQVRSVGEEGAGNYSDLVLYMPQRCGECQMNSSEEGHTQYILQFYLPMHCTYYSAPVHAILVLSVSMSAPGSSTSTIA